MLIAFFVVAGLVASLALWRMYWRMGARRFLAFIAIFAGIAGVAIVLQRVTGCGEDPPRPALVDETIGGARWLRHPQLRFHHPGADFVADDKLVSLIEVRVSHCYAFSRGDVDAVVVCTIRQPIESKQQWAMQVAGTRRGIERAVSGHRPPLSFDQLGARLVSEDTGWADGVGTAFFHHVLDAGIAVRTKLFTISGGFAVMLATARADDLAGVVASFERR